MAKPKKISSLLIKNRRTITSKVRDVKSVTTLKPQRTRQLIRRFHILQKKRSSIIKVLQGRRDQAVADTVVEKHIKKSHNYIDSKRLTIDSINLKAPGDIEFKDNDPDSHLIQLVGCIDGEIEKRGGLETYQVASTLGQSRGGDSSRKLMEWLEQYHVKEGVRKPTALEIGCLDAKNAISRSTYFSNVTRIDLRSQDKTSILEQDFMERPLPNSLDEKFNLVSCSLVVNFVPSAVDRGEMMKRITKFLKPPSAEDPIAPMLFFVLPLPCVANSRYFDNVKFDQIMSCLGFKKLQYYEAKKIAYWLWEWTGKVKVDRNIEKKELHPGGQRNNFCIVVNK